MLNVPRQMLVDWAKGADLGKGRGVTAMRRTRRKMIERMFRGEIDVMGVSSTGLLEVRGVPKRVQADRRRRRAQRQARRQTRRHA